MARTFKREWVGLPNVKGHVWPLLERIDELLRPYAPLGSGLLKFQAEDSRGVYDAESVKELRQEADKQEEPPQIFRITLEGDEKVMYLTIWKDRHSDGFVVGKDEAFVDHVAARVEKLYALVAAAANPKAQARATFPVPGQKQKPEEEEWRQVWPEKVQEPTEQERPYVAPLSQTPQSAPQVPFWMQHATTLIVTVVGTVLAGVILALILGSN